MARLTPNEILKLSEPVEQVYSNIVDALLINMGKHFNSGHSLSTEQWDCLLYTSNWICLCCC